MLATRIIPTVLCNGRTMVKGERFNPWRSCGLAAQAVRIHQKRGVDELCLLDVKATPEGRGPDLALVEELSDVCFMPLAVGGGIRTKDDVRALLKAGADKVVIGTEFAKRPEFVEEVTQWVGRQAVVVSIEYRDMKHLESGREAFVVRAECGQAMVKLRDEPITPVEFAEVAQRAGAGEILLTSIDHEGRMEGYHLPMLERVARAVDIPVIAHGGCGTYQDMVDAVHAGASAVAAGALFLWTDCTPREAACVMRGYGIETRIA